MDWKTKFFQVLDCFSVQEGCWFENKWKDFGVSEEETAKINYAFTQYDESRHKPRQVYVAGFYINNLNHTVALIQKKNPEWQRGKLNAIGGKVEPGETPAAAMRREFFEEAGVDTDGWEPTVITRGEGWEVHFFRAFGDVSKVMTMEDEPVGIFNYDELPKIVIPNLRWLMPLQLEVNVKFPIVIEE